MQHLNRRVLIAGASGFLGKPLVEALQRCGAATIPVGRRRHAEGWYAADVADLDAVRELFRETRPEILYHLVSESRGDRDPSVIQASLRNDVLASVNLYQAALEFGVERVIATGSLEEPRGEADAAIPTTPYAAAKYTSSIYARMFRSAYGLKIALLRPYMTYGPGQKPYKVVPATIRALLNGETAKLGSGTRPVDWVYVDDVVEAFVSAATADDIFGSTIDLGSGVGVTIRECMELLAELIGPHARLEFGAVPDRGEVRIADTRLAADRLGWTARTSLREGLQRTIESVRQQIAGPR
jgi:UDP-glucose 4-epimerase